MLILFVLPTNVSSYPRARYFVYSILLKKFGWKVKYFFIFRSFWKLGDTEKNVFDVSLIDYKLFEILLQNILMENISVWIKQVLSLKIFLWRLSKYLSFWYFILNQYRIMFIKFLLLPTLILKSIRKNIYTVDFSRFSFDFRWFSKKIRRRKQVFHQISSSLGFSRSLSQIMFFDGKFPKLIFIRLMAEITNSLHVFFSDSLTCEAFFSAFKSK